MEDPFKRVLLTPKEAAVIMKRHYLTVIRLCKEGKLRHCKIGRAIRIDPVDANDVKWEENMRTF